MTETDCCKTCSIRIDALDRRIDRRFLDLETRLDERFDTQKENLKSEASGLSRRLDGMNEFRQTLTDQASRFIDRDIFGLLRDRVEKLERWPWLAAGIFTVAGVVLGLIFKFMT